jgi:DNA-binding CsgD family transcriptional regulator
MLATRGGSYDILSLDADAADVSAGVRDGEEALALARSSALPAAEAFALVQLAVILGPRGEYGRALDLAQHALQTAEAIGHGQWTRGAHQALGALYLDLLAPAEALPHLERALAVARAVGSIHWSWQTVGRLAVAHLELHQPERAAAILSELPDANGDTHWAARWWATYARARLALARRDAELALRLCDELRGPGSGETPPLVRLRAQALAALGHTDEAETDLRMLREAMRRQSTRSELWRTHAALGHLYRASDRVEDARLEFAAARAVIEQVAANIPDERLRGGFLQNATAHLPRAYRLSPLSTAAARFGGLTAREREVAALIARGKANAEIAAALVLGRRTIETHVTNILTKLGVSSRREIADWVSRVA